MDQFFTGWVYSVGKSMYGRQQAKMNMKLFRFNSIYLVLFITIAVIFKEPVTASSGRMNMMLPWPILIGGLYYLFAAFYNVHFAAKMFTNIQQKVTGKGNYEKNFFYFLAFFIGIWIIQPKVNKIVTVVNEKG